MSDQNVADNFPTVNVPPKPGRLCHPSTIIGASRATSCVQSCNRTPYRIYPSPSCCNPWRALETPFDRGRTEIGRTSPMSSIGLPTILVRRASRLGRSRDRTALCGAARSSHAIHASERFRSPTLPTSTSGLIVSLISWRVLKATPVPKESYPQVM
jgi:hypothetical protein